MRRPLLLGFALAGLLACSQTRDAPSALVTPAQQAPFVEPAPAPAAAATHVIERYIVQLCAECRQGAGDDEDKTGGDEDEATPIVFDANCNDPQMRDEAIVCALRDLKPKPNWLDKVFDLLTVLLTFVSGVVTAIVAQHLAAKRAEEDRLRAAIDSVAAVERRAFHVWGDLLLHANNVSNNKPTTNAAWLAHVVPLKDMFDVLSTPGAISLVQSSETIGVTTQLNAAVYMAKASGTIMAQLETALNTSAAPAPNTAPRFDGALALVIADFLRLRTVTLALHDELRQRLKALKKRWF